MKLGERSLRPHDEGSDQSDSDDNDGEDAESNQAPLSPLPLRTPQQLDQFNPLSLCFCGFPVLGRTERGEEDDDSGEPEEWEH